MNLSKQWGKKKEPYETPESSPVPPKTGGGVRKFFKIRDSVQKYARKSLHMNPPEKMMDMVLSTPADEAYLAMEVAQEKKMKRIREEILAKMNTIHSRVAQAMYSSGFEIFDFEETQDTGGLHAQDKANAEQIQRQQEFSDYKNNVLWRIDIIKEKVSEKCMLLDDVLHWLQGFNLTEKIAGHDLDLASTLEASGAFQHILNDLKNVESRMRKLAKISRILIEDVRLKFAIVSRPIPLTVVDGVSLLANNNKFSIAANTMETAFVSAVKWLEKPAHQENVNMGLEQLKHYVAASNQRFQYIDRIEDRLHDLNNKLTEATFDNKRINTECEGLRSVVNGFQKDIFELNDKIGVMKVETKMQAHKLVEEEKVRKDLVEKRKEAESKLQISVMNKNKAEAEVLELTREIKRQKTATDDDKRKKKPDPIRVAGDKSPPMRKTYNPPSEIPTDSKALKQTYNDMISAIKDLEDQVIKAKDSNMELHTLLVEKDVDLENFKKKSTHLESLVNKDPKLAAAVPERVKTDLQTIAASMSTFHDDIVHAINSSRLPNAEAIANKIEKFTMEKNVPNIEAMAETLTKSVQSQMSSIQTGFLDLVRSAKMGKVKGKASSSQLGPTRDTAPKGRTRSGSVMTSRPTKFEKEGQKKRARTSMTGSVSGIISPEVEIGSRPSPSLPLTSDELSKGGPSPLLEVPFAYDSGGQSTPEKVSVSISEPADHKDQETQYDPSKDSVSLMSQRMQSQRSQSQRSQSQRSHSLRSDTASVSERYSVDLSTSKDKLRYPKMTGQMHIRSREDEMSPLFSDFDLQADTSLPESVPLFMGSDYILSDEERKSNKEHQLVDPLTGKAFTIHPKSDPGIVGARPSQTDQRYGSSFTPRPGLPSQADDQQSMERPGVVPMARTPPPTELKPLYTKDGKLIGHLHAATDALGNVVDPRELIQEYINRSNLVSAAISGGRSRTGSISSRAGSRKNSMINRQTLPMSTVMATDVEQALSAYKLLDEEKGKVIFKETTHPFFDKNVIMKMHMDSRGLFHDAIGKLIDEEGCYIDKDGRYIDEEGRLVNKHGDYIDTAGNILEIRPSSNIITHGHTVGRARRRSRSGPASRAHSITGEQAALIRAARRKSLKSQESFVASHAISQLGSHYQGLHASVGDVMTASQTFSSVGAPHLPPLSEMQNVPGHLMGMTQPTVHLERTMTMSPEQETQSSYTESHSIPTQQTISVPSEQISTRSQSKATRAKTIDSEVQKATATVVSSQIPVPGLKTAAQRQALTQQFITGAGRKINEEVKKGLQMTLTTEKVSFKPSSERGVRKEPETREAVPIEMTTSNRERSYESKVPKQRGLQRHETTKGPIPMKPLTFSPRASLPLTDDMIPSLSKEVDSPIKIAERIAEMTQPRKKEKSRRSREKSHDRFIKSQDSSHLTQMPSPFAAEFDRTPSGYEDDFLLMTDEDHVTDHPLIAGIYHYQQSHIDEFSGHYIMANQEYAMQSQTFMHHDDPTTMLMASGQFQHMPILSGGSLNMIPSGSAAMMPTGLLSMIPSGSMPMTPSSPSNMIPSGISPMMPGGTMPMMPGGTMPMTPSGPFPVMPGASMPMTPSGPFPMMPGGIPPMMSSGTFPILPSGSQYTPIFGKTPDRMTPDSVKMGSPPGMQAFNEYSEPTTMEEMSNMAAELAQQQFFQGEAQRAMMELSQMETGPQQQGQHGVISDPTHRLQTLADYTRSRQKRSKASLPSSRASSISRDDITSDKSRERSPSCEREPSLSVGSTEPKYVEQFQPKRVPLSPKASVQKPTIQPFAPIQSQQLMSGVPKYIKPMQKVKPLMRDLTKHQIAKIKRQIEQTVEQEMRSSIQSLSQQFSLPDIEFINEIVQQEIQWEVHKLIKQHIQQIEPMVLKLQDVVQDDIDEIVEEKVTSDMEPISTTEILRIHDEIHNMMQRKVEEKIENNEEPLTDEQVELVREEITLQIQRSIQKIRRYSKEMPKPLQQIQKELKHQIQDLVQENIDQHLSVLCSEQFSADRVTQETIQSPIQPLAYEIVKQHIHQLTPPQIAQVHQDVERVVLMDVQQEIKQQAHNFTQPQMDHIQQHAQQEVQHEVKNKISTHLQKIEPVVLKIGKEVRDDITQHVREKTRDVLSPTELTQVQQVIEKDMQQHIEEKGRQQKPPLTQQQIDYVQEQIPQQIKREMQKTLRERSRNIPATVRQIQDDITGKIDNLVQQRLGEQVRRMSQPQATLDSEEIPRILPPDQIIQLEALNKIKLLVKQRIPPLPSDQAQMWQIHQEIQSHVLAEVQMKITQQAYPLSQPQIMRIFQTIPEYVHKEIQQAIMSLTVSPEQQILSYSSQRIKQLVQHFIQPQFLPMDQSKIFVIHRTIQGQIQQEVQIKIQQFAPMLSQQQAMQIHQQVLLQIQMEIQNALSQQRFSPIQQQQIAVQSQRGSPEEKQHILQETQEQIQQLVDEKIQLPRTEPLTQPMLSRVHDEIEEKVQNETLQKTQASRRLSRPEIMEIQQRIPFQIQSEIQNKINRVVSPENVDNATQLEIQRMVRERLQPGAKTMTQNDLVKLHEEIQSIIQERIQRKQQGFTMLDEQSLVSTELDKDSIVSPVSEKKEHDAISRVSAAQKSASPLSEAGTERKSSLKLQRTHFSTETIPVEPFSPVHGTPSMEEQKEYKVMKPLSNTQLVDIHLTIQNQIQQQLAQNELAKRKKKPISPEVEPAVTQPQGELYQHITSQRKQRFAPPPRPDALSNFQNVAHTFTPLGYEQTVQDLQGTQFVPSPQDMQSAAQSRQTSRPPSQQLSQQPSQRQSQQPSQQASQQQSQRQSQQPSRQASQQQSQDAHYPFQQRYTQSMLDTIEQVSQAQQKFPTTSQAMLPSQQATSSTMPQPPQMQQMMYQYPTPYQFETTLARSLKKPSPQASAPQDLQNLTRQPPLPDFFPPYTVSAYAPAPQSQSDTLTKQAQQPSNIRQLKRPVISLVKPFATPKPDTPPTGETSPKDEKPKDDTFSSSGKQPSATPTLDIVATPLTSPLQRRSVQSEPAPTFTDDKKPRKSIHAGVADVADTLTFPELIEGLDSIFKADMIKPAGHKEKIQERSKPHSYESHGGLVKAKWSGRQDVLMRQKSTPQQIASVEGRSMLDKDNRYTQSDELGQKPKSHHDGWSDESFIPKSVTTSLIPVTSIGPQSTCLILKDDTVRVTKDDHIQITRPVRERNELDIDFVGVESLSKFATRQRTTRWVPVSSQAMILEINNAGVPVNTSGLETQFCWLPVEEFQGKVGTRVNVGWVPTSYMKRPETSSEKIKYLKMISIQKARMRMSTSMLQLIEDEIIAWSKDMDINSPNPVSIEEKVIKIQDVIKNRDVLGLSVDCKSQLETQLLSLLRHTTEPTGELVPIERRRAMVKNVLTEARNLHLDDVVVSTLEVMFDTLNITDSRRRADAVNTRMKHLRRVIDETTTALADADIKKITESVISFVKSSLEVQDVRPEQQASELTDIVHPEIIKKLPSDKIHILQDETIKLVRYLLVATKRPVSERIKNLQAAIDRAKKRMTDEAALNLMQAEEDCREGMQKAYENMDEQFLEERLSVLERVITVKFDRRYVKVSHIARWDVELMELKKLAGDVGLTGCLVMRCILPHKRGLVNESLDLTTPSFSPRFTRKGFPTIKVPLPELKGVTMKPTPKGRPPTYSFEQPIQDPNMAPPQIVTPRMLQMDVQRRFYKAHSMFTRRYPDY